MGVAEDAKSRPEAVAGQSSHIGAEMKAIALILLAPVSPALAQPMADGHTLSAEELKECVQYKHDTVSQIDES